MISQTWILDQIMDYTHYVVAGSQGGSEVFITNQNQKYRQAGPVNVPSHVNFRIFAAFLSLFYIIHSSSPLPVTMLYGYLLYYVPPKLTHIIQSIIRTIEISK